MRTVLVFAAVLLGLVASPGPSEAAPDRKVDVIVDRYDDRIEIYLATRADNFVTALGLDPTLLAGPDGTVAFEPLRQGTWEIGDALFAGTVATLNNAPITLEAMSLMVHPLDQALPMRDPFEAMMAIAVCTVDDPANPPTLDALQGYVGFIAYVDGGDGLLTLQLPRTGRGDLQVTIGDFRAGQRIAKTVAIVPDGGSLEIESQTNRAGAVALILLALGSLAAGALAVRRFGWSERAGPGPA